MTEERWQYLIILELEVRICRFFCFMKKILFSRTIGATCLSCLRFLSNPIRSFWHLMSALVFTLRHCILNRELGRRNSSAISKGSIVIVALIANEELYLAEFIDHHRRNGVNHFFFYDNSTSKAQEKVLHPYITNGIVTLYRCPPFGFVSQLLFRSWKTNSQHYRHSIISRLTLKPSVQEIALFHFHFLNRRSDFWMLQIDIDEFLYSPNGHSLREVFNRLYAEGVCSISVPEFEFGSSYQIEYPESVIAGYTKRCPKTRSPKSCARSSHVSCHFNAHSFSAKTSSFNLFRDIRQKIPFSPGKSIDLAGKADDCLRLNHYKSKCLRDLVERRFLLSRENSYLLSQLVELYSSCNEIECRVLLDLASRQL